MKEVEDHDTHLSFQYISHIVSELHNMIRYSDSKHTLGMTLVVSFLFAASEFIVPKLDKSVFEVRLILNLNIASALIAVGFGYLGIYPVFISPPRLRATPKGTPNLFYFLDIRACGPAGLRQALDQAFPHSRLSDTLKEQSVAEIYALSVIAARKFLMFKFFLYALFLFLVSLGWLFLSTAFSLTSVLGR